MRSAPAAVFTLLVGLMPACTSDDPTPFAARGARQAGAGRAAWGPETPNFNLEVVLRGQGFGLVKFRQPNDAQRIVYLDTWVRDLAPNTAVPASAGGRCDDRRQLHRNGVAHAGEGSRPQSIPTDGRGRDGRNCSGISPRSPRDQQFDIHFRVIDAVTQAVVLESECYQFRVSL